MDLDLVARGEPRTWSTPTQLPVASHATIQRYLLTNPHATTGADPDDIPTLSSNVNYQLNY